MLLEEKRIPYRVEKINMRSYGDKPQSFLRKGDATLHCIFTTKNTTNLSTIAVCGAVRSPMH
jgi:hypothetical protein